MAAIESLVIPGLELAMKLANASLGRDFDSFVLEPDQRGVTENIKGLQLTASSRTNSHTDLNKLDETRGNNAVEEGDFLINERNIDRQTHTHHRHCILKFWRSSSFAKRT